MKYFVLQHKGFRCLRKTWIFAFTLSSVWVKMTGIICIIWLTTITFILHVRYWNQCFWQNLCAESHKFSTEHYKEWAINHVEAKTILGGSEKAAIRTYFYDKRKYICCLETVITAKKAKTGEYVYSILSERYGKSRLQALSRKNIWRISME